MPNPARTDHDILPAFQHRWSPRAYADRPVDGADLKRCLEAARWAASSFNEQPWRLIVGVKDHPELGDTHAKILDILAPPNAAWAEKAHVLLVGIYKEAFTKNNKPNRCAPHDLGAACAQMASQAAELGLQAHGMAGLDLDATRRAFDIPDGYQPWTAWAIGHPGDPADLPEDWMRDAETAERARHPFDQWVFGGSFAQPAAL